MQPTEASLMQVPFTSYLDYTQDKSLGGVRLVNGNTKQVVRRTDSSKHRKPSVNVKCDFSKALNCSKFVMKSGDNHIVLSKRVDKSGVFKVGQLSIIVEEKLEFLSVPLNPPLCYEVSRTQPTITVKCDGDLLAGLVQTIKFIIATGSIAIKKNSVLKFRAMRGLTLRVNNQDDEFTKGLECAVPECAPFNTINMEFQVFAELPPKKDSSSMEHKVIIQHIFVKSL